MVLNTNKKSLVYAGMIGTSIADAWEDMIDMPTRYSIWLNAYVENVKSMVAANEAGDSELGHRYLMAGLPIGKTLADMRAVMAKLDKNPKLPSSAN